MSKVQETSSDYISINFINETPIEVNNVIFYTNVPRTERLSFEDFSPRGTFQQKTVVDLVTFDQTANGWIAYVREGFYAFPQVESIYYTIDDTDIDIWLIIPTRDFSLLRRLVDLEMRILGIFSSADLSLYRFEFHILYRNNSNENQLVPKRALRLPK